jgi:pyrroline-5-carboxylate reductase
MFESIGFIGAGRVARILLGGWQHAGRLPADIRAYDANPAAVEVLQAEFPAVQSVPLSETASAHLVFAALPPPAMGEVMTAMAGHLRPDAVLCSLAPKVKLAVLTEKLAGFSRLARMNPNAPSTIGKGYNPIVFGDRLPGAERSALQAILAPLGQLPEVAEPLLETYAVISAMGPTYFGFQFAEVERLATSFGLDAVAARQAMLAMVEGTAALLFASDVPQATALDLVPVRPLAEHEADIRQKLRDSVTGIHTKLTS